MTALVLSIAILGFVLLVLPALFLFFDFRGTDFLFLIPVLLPTVWLSRLDRHYLLLGDSPFYLLWGLLLAAIPAFWLIGDARTRELLREGFRRIWLPLTLFVLLLLISNLCYAQNNADIFRGLQSIGYMMVPMAAAWFIVRACRMDRQRIPQLVLCLFIFGTVIGTVGILAAVMPAMFRSIVTTQNTDVEVGRAFSTVGGPSATAMCLLLVYSLAAGQFLGGRRRLLCAVVMAICFLGILTTLARAALLCFVVATLVVFAGKWRGLGRRLAIALLITLVLFLPSIYWLGRVYSLERFTADRPGQPLGGSWQARLESMTAAAAYGAKRPFLGGGWGLVYTLGRGEAERVTTWRTLYLDGYRSANRPHSLFLMTLAEAGLPALLALIWFFAAIWRSLRPPDESSDRFAYGIAQGFRAGLLSFLLMCVVQDTLYVSTKVSLVFFLFVFLGMAVGANYRAAETVWPAEAFNSAKLELGRPTPKRRVPAWAPTTPRA